MDKIIILDEALISKIAAGEVIERPASIVKELIENSIDADSKKIFIELRQSGKTHIKVSDDGLGMSKKDAELSWKRHTTSKIKDVKDLFSIHTLGFRGEALASIASVSELIITTRQEEELSGIKISVKSGKEISKESIGCPKGTSIEVKELFFNTPARKKYMKSDDIELGHITDIVTRYALIHPEIHFRLTNNGKEILDSPGTEDWLTAISFIYGKDSKALVNVDFEDNNISIKGFVSKPELSRPTRNDQSIYVNKRYIKKNKTISDALNNAFHTYVMVNRYPVAILNIEIKTEKIDVNVHPQKAEIRIEDEKQIYDSVFNAVKKTLSETDLVPEAMEKEVGKKILDYFPKGTPKHVYPEQGKQQLLVKEKDAEEKLLELNILGVINKTYLLAEIPGNILLIDQHAAAERLLYEKFTEQLRNKKVEIQKLLNPEIMELSPKQYVAASYNKEILLELGYETEDFGRNTILIRTLPVILGRQFDKALFIDFIDEIEKKGKPESLEKFFHDRIARMSCRTAIKAGDDITLPQINQYILGLKENQVYTCPHGRPIMIRWSFYELEKMFKRVV